MSEKMKRKSLYTKTDADRILKILSPLVNKKVDGASIGRSNVIGGVEKRGWSKNDLDLLIECKMTPEAEKDTEGEVFERDWYRCIDAIAEFMEKELKCKAGQHGDEGGVIISTPFFCPIDKETEWIIDIVYDAVWPSEKR